MCDINLSVCVCVFYNFRGIKLKKAMQTIYELPIVFIVEQTRQVTESKRKNGLFCSVLFFSLCGVCVRTTIGMWQSQNNSFKQALGSFAKDFN